MSHLLSRQGEIVKDKDFEVILGNLLFNYYDIVFTMCIHNALTTDFKVAQYFLHLILTLHR